MTHPPTGSDVGLIVKVLAEFTFMVYCCVPGKPLIVVSIASIANLYEPAVVTVPPGRQRGRGSIRRLQDVTVPATWTAPTWTAPMTLVKTLAEMHGGRVEAHSDGPGKGSEFVVHLLLLSEGERMKDEEVGVPAPDSSLSLHPSSLKVLVVDDNIDAAESLTMLLHAWGHEVRTAHDGLTARGLAEQFRPEVVLLDIGLPRMDGYEVARRLRTQDGMGHVLLVALTGYGQQEDRHRAAEAGFNRHLTKPANPAALQALLAETSAPSG